MQNMDNDAFSLVAVYEAIETLGLIKPDAAPFILSVVHRLGADPNALLAVRKTGTQLTKQEKADLGLSARAFMNKELLEHLTPLGMPDPTNAYAITCQRAFLSAARHEALQNARESVFPSVARRVCPYTTDCEPQNDWLPLNCFDGLPPTACGDCVYRTCRSGFVFRREGRP